MVMRTFYHFLATFCLVLTSCFGFGQSTPPVRSYGWVAYVNNGSNPYSIPMDIGQWQYIAITKDNNNVATIYKNGQQVFRGSYENVSYSWNRIDLGASFFTSYLNWFTGEIDEIRVSNIARSSSSIASSFSSNSPFTSDVNTLGLWHFDQNSGNSITSITGSTGTITNATWNSQGKFGQCLSFNGSNSRAQINQSVPTTTMTFEFWIKPTINQNSWPISWYGANTAGFGMNIDTAYQLVPSYVPTNGLVGWWEFSGNARDGSGNGNYGIVNGANLTSDRFGNQNRAFHFPGNVNNKITVPHSSDFNFLSEFTVSTWFQFTQPWSYHTESLIYKKSVTENNGWHIGVDQNDFGNGIGKYRIQSEIIPGVSVDTCCNTFNFINSWRHLVFVYSGDSLIMYLDGNFIKRIPYSGNLHNNLSPIVFGGSVNPVSGAYNRNIDDIGIWNRALTQQEITNLYNSQLLTQSSLCLPTITTSSPSSVGVDSALISGNITNDGGSSIVLRGVCYSTSPNPNMGNSRTEVGSGIGSFSTVLRGLTSSTTYYARSYAKNSNGVVVYGNEVSFTTSASLPGVRCPGTPTVTDIDGNTYNTVQIGNQCWTQSNLKVSKYRNGDNIPTGLSNSVWQNTTSGAYAIYNNDPVNDGLYGKLYNHYAVTDTRGLCPTGWHLPSDGEWNLLVKYLDSNADTVCVNCIQSSIAGGALKSTAMQPTPGGWNAPNVGATNSSGFTAPPGGLRVYDGDFFGMASYGCWWSSSVSSASNAWGRELSSGFSLIFRDYTYDRPYGFSVRCLKNSIPQVNTTSVTNVATSTALVIGELSSDGGDQNTTRGFCYSTTSNPTVSNDTTMNGTGLGVYTDTLQNLTTLTTYYVRAYATNGVGTSYGNEKTFTSAPGQPCTNVSTVTDIDGNIYYTVQIGSQCWTQSNLKVSKYGNGDNIPTGLVNSAWQNTTSGAYAICNNDPVNDGLYGKLYNHYAVTDSRGLCPTGWHVPSDAEWTTLANHLGGSSVAGGSLKSTAMQPTLGGWNPPNTGATNTSGFTALPGSLRGFNGNFSGTTDNGSWWSSSVSFASNAWSRVLTSSSSSFYSFSGTRSFGFSVRCLKD